MYFEYATPFVVEDELEAAKSPRTDQDFWGEIAAAFCMLFYETKGKIRKRGEFKFLSVGFWPFWLVPIGEDFSLIVDGLGLTDYRVASIPKVKFRDVNKSLKSRGLRDFIARLKKLDFEVKRAAQTTTRSQEDIKGLFHPEIVQFLRSFFLQVTRVYTDSFFLFDPRIRETDAVMQRAKLNYLIHGEGVGTIATQRDEVLEKVNYYLEHQGEEIATLEAQEEDTEEEEREIEELEDQLQEVQQVPLADSDEDLLRSGRFTIPEIPGNLVEEIDHIKRTVSRIQQYSSRLDITALYEKAHDLVEHATAVYNESRSYEAELQRLVQAVQQERQQLRKAREDEVEMLESRIQDLKTQFDQREQQREEGLDIRRSLHDELLQLRQDIARDYAAWLETEETHRQNFFDSFAVTIGGSLQVIGFPIYFFGFQRNGRMSILPYLPHVAETKKRWGGGINFKRTRVRNYLRGLLKKYLKEDTNRTFMLDQGRMQDLTRLPDFRRKVKTGLHILRIKEYISDRAFKVVTHMVEHDFPGLEYRERANQGGQ